jgi:undecaprenyl-diphosphatase
MRPARRWHRASIHERFVSVFIDISSVATSSPVSMNDYVLSLIFGIVEGLTEFLPVSSTAHIRLSQFLLGVAHDDPYWKLYAIVIQLGAILSVVVYFRKRITDFLRSFPRGADGDRTLLTHPLSLILIAFVVTAGPCLIIDKKIGDNLESLTIIGVSLIVGGIAMWAIDVWAGRREAAARAELHAPQLDAQPIVTVSSDPDPSKPPTAPADFEAAPAGVHGAKGGLTWRLEDVTLTQSIVIGAAQILAAAFPGTSRSMSTIAAGQVMRLSRPAALEFSFFLSIPVMFAATGFKLLQALMKSRKGELGFAMDAHLWGVLGVGFAVSFVVALLVIHWFMAWVRTRGFVPFAIYRIVAGAVVLYFAMRGA